MLDRKAREELAQRLLDAPEGEPVPLNVHGGSSQTPPLSVSITQVLEELRQMHPMAVELATERAARKQLQQEVQMLVDALAQRDRQEDGQV